MKRSLSINFSNLLLSLSEAVDLASPVISYHQERTAFIAWEIATAAGLKESTIKKIFSAALLHDIGALTTNEKIDLHNFEVADTSPHCIRGMILLKNNLFFSDLAEIIRYHHTAWQDWNKSLTEPNVMESQIICIADYIERLINRDEFILHQSQRIVDEINQQSNILFNSEIVDRFNRIAAREEFWLDVTSSRLHSLLIENGPYKNVEIGYSDLFAISTLFRNIIDFKSRFTATHSAGVSACAELLSKLYGFAGLEIQLMKVAGNFHDLGKLIVPNDILEKPEKLTDAEHDIIKSHSYHTFHILNAIKGIQTIAEWASYHHEKLDGSGYPFRCTSIEMTICSRIMAVADIFTALAEDRPYREGMEKDKIIKIIGESSKKKLIDSIIVELLFDNFDKIKSYTKGLQKIALDFYESQFTYTPM
jgi:HD-GYP domain-containing protein (c-di-GMP phosphodiesterase class II)